MEAGIGTRFARGKPGTSVPAWTSGSGAGRSLGSDKLGSWVSVGGFVECCGFISGLTVSIPGERRGSSFVDSETTVGAAEGLGTVGLDDTRVGSAGARTFFGVDGIETESFTVSGSMSTSVREVPRLEGWGSGCCGGAVSAFTPSSASKNGSKESAGLRTTR